MTDYRTPYGVLHYGGPCEDDYPNMVVYDQGGGHTILKLQRSAMKAFWAAEIRYARSVGWTKQRIERNDGHGRPILVLPGTNRTCETQRRLWLSDRSRYASPDVTGHTRGIALDVSQAQPNLSKVNAALRAEGWKQVRSDEPWHWSYFVAV